MAQLCSNSVSSKGSGNIPTKLWEQRQNQCVGVLKILPSSLIQSPLMLKVSVDCIKTWLKPISIRSLSQKIWLNPIKY